MRPEADLSRRLLLQGIAAGAALAATPVYAVAAETSQKTFAEAAGRLGIVGAAASICGTEDRAIVTGRASIPFDVPVSPATLFHIGSNGKHITAAAVLRLVDQGKLSLDTPIGDIVEGLPTPWRSRRIASLLSHTSGVPEYGGFDWDRSYDRKAFLALFTKTDPEFEEGAAWTYSNTGYVLLGWAIEDISGKPYRAVIDELFRTLALPSAKVDDAGAAIPMRAEPYDARSQPPRHAIRMAGDVSGWPDGGVLFSARDFPIWNRALDGGLMSPALRRAMFAPTRLSTDRSVPYGYGLFVDPLRGKPRQWHGGGVPGFTSWFTRDDQMSIMLMTNVSLDTSARVRHLGNVLIEAVAPGTSLLSLKPQRDAHAALTRTTLAGLVEGEGRRFRLKGSPLSFELVEEFAEPGQMMRRYRATWPDYVEHVLVGYDDREQIFWAFGN